MKKEEFNVNREPVKFNLSEKRIGMGIDRLESFWYPESEVKEFIKKLKEELRRPMYGLPICTCCYYDGVQDPKCKWCKFMKRINKLAGEKLT